MKIDVFCHITPPNFLTAFERKVSSQVFKELPCHFLPSLTDLELRFRIMDQFEGMKQVLTLTNPPIELVMEPEHSVDLARLVNNEMAELVEKYPDRFVGAVACLPMNDLDAALQEVDRTILDLNFKGVQLYSHIAGKPLDLPEFFPIYEKMVKHNLPIWIHPFFQSIGTVAKTSEQFSNYRVFTGEEDHAWAMERAVFGLPAASASAMTRLVYGGVLEKYPDIKFITHHCGALVPYLTGRIEMHYNMFKEREGVEQGITKPPLEYYEMFYGDTALHGNQSALMCGYNFFGADHLLFGTDMPFDGEQGAWSIHKTIESIEQMDVSGAEKKQIFEDNARQLLQLSI